MRVTQRQLEQMIRYEDAFVIVVHKPPFLAVETRAAGQQDLRSLLNNRAAAKGEPPVIEPVHRLDQPVEGLLVLAKTNQAAAALSRSLQQGDFCKEYLAVVNGVTEESGVLEHTLKKDGRTNTSSVVPAGTEGGKTARLSYERIAVCEDWSVQPEHVCDAQGCRLVPKKKSLLCIRLDTGRHHQIRVQLSAAGHPLVGDAKYGAPPAGERQPLALCSYRLCFPHPATGQDMQLVTAPAGAGFLPFSDELASFLQREA